MMRHASEIRNGEELLKLTHKLSRLLLVPSVNVLADTVVVLHALVNLSDKVLTLKCYFNVVQEIQRGKVGLASAARQSDEDEEIINVKREECTEDVFMVACSFLNVEIAKQGSFYYLRGESPDASTRKETKTHRNPIDITDEVVLKTVASSLARPDEERGKVEISQIISGCNHLARLVKLHQTMPAAVAYLKSDSNIKKIDVRKHFALSHTDYETVMAMARRSNLIGFRNRKRAPDNEYKLNTAHHEMVLEKAKELGVTPNKALNQMLDDFKMLVELTAKSTAKGAG